MRAPAVSVVIPFFNQADYLSDCIQSVQRQQYVDWEIVVVDDASTDADASRLVEGASDGRIRLVRHEVNRGLGAARNTGFTQALADYVVPLDADDRLHPEYLSATLGAIDAGREADCAFTDWQLFGVEEGVWRWNGPYGLPSLLSRQTMPGPGTLMSKELWRRAGGYSEDKRLLGNEDWDFWLAATAAGIRPEHVPRPLYLYRRHGTSMSSTSLDTDAYFQQEIIYFRHQETFDRFGGGGRFRAAGYLRSIVHAWANGRRRDALVLFGRGLTTRGVGFSVARAVAATMGGELARRVSVRRLRAGLRVGARG